MPSLFRRFFALMTLIAVLAPAMAAGDPPARVGRLSLVDGNVTYRASQQDAGGPALVNWPVSSGAIVDTGRGARAEVWIGSTAYRLGSDSQAEFATVDDRSVALLLHGGTLAVTIRDRDQADDLAVTTPAGQVRFSGTGRYRLEVAPDRTTIAAQSGSAEIFANERPVTLRAGEMVTIDGRGVLTIEATRYGDDFDAWVSARDNREKSAQARRNVSPYMTGYDDLDSHGDWSTAEDYGTVWYPRAVAADWAPYRYGRWAWVEPWGWTWVDAAPWGFAPFHYGRWVQVRGRWGWAPGAYVARPVYAPALVGWVGNPGWNANFRYGSAPAVGWFPLAPREVYVPAYRTSPTYIRQVNVTHVRNAAEVDRALRPDHRPNYAHHGQPHAVTVVPTNTLRDGRPIDRAAIRPHDRHELGQAPAAARAPGSEWLAPGAGAARPGRHMEQERHPSAPLPGLSQQPPQPAMRGPQASPDVRQPFPTPESGPRFPAQDTSRIVPNDGRNLENRGRFPSQEERQPGRAAPSPSTMPEAPRAEQRARQTPVMPSLSPAPEPSRPAPPPMREMPQPAATAQEPRREPFRQAPPQERPAAPMLREAQRPMPMPMPAPSASAPMREMPQPVHTPRELRRESMPHERPPPPMVREAPRPMPPPPAPMREMPRPDQRPPAHADRDRDRGGNPGHKEHRGERGMQ